MRPRDPLSTSICMGARMAAPHSFGDCQKECARRLLRGHVSSGRISVVGSEVLAARFIVGAISVGAATYVVGAAEAAARQRHGLTNTSITH
jgi:hypothetical protein